MPALATVAYVPVVAHAEEACTQGDGGVIAYACAGAKYEEGDECLDSTNTVCDPPMVKTKPKKPSATIWFYCGNGRYQQGRPCDIIRT